MKHSFLYFLLFLLASTATAQKAARGWLIGGGIAAGFPVTKPFRYAAGGDIRLLKPLSHHLTGTLTAGFTHYFEKDHFAEHPQYSSPFNVIPVKAGIRLFIGNRFYIGGEAGAGFGMEEWGTSFLWSPSLGLVFRNGIDLSVKYEDYIRNAATKNLAIRLAYEYPARRPVLHQKRLVPNEWQLGVALHPGLQTNTFRDPVLGGEITLKNRLNSRLEASVSTGLVHYFKNGYNQYLYMNAPDAPIVYLTRTARNLVPVTAGLRFFAYRQWYVQGHAGTAFGLRGNTSFVYTPSLGRVCKNGIDIGFRYDRYHSQEIRNTLSIRLGYYFKH